MNTNNVKHSSSKSLQLKKAAISNLSISEEKLKMIIGGYGIVTDDTGTSVLVLRCTGTNDTKAV